MPIPPLAWSLGLRSTMTTCPQAVSGPGPRHWWMEQTWTHLAAWSLKSSLPQQTCRQPTDLRVRHFWSGLLCSINAAIADDTTVFWAHLPTTHFSFFSHLHAARLVFLKPKTNSSQNKSKFHSITLKSLLSEAQTTFPFLLPAILIHWHQPSVSYAVHKYATHCHTYSLAWAVFLPLFNY